MDRSMAPNNMMDFITIILIYPVRIFEMGEQEPAPPPLRYKYGECYGKSLWDGPYLRKPRGLYYSENQPLHGMIFLGSRSLRMIRHSLPGFPASTKRVRVFPAHPRDP